MANTKTARVVWSGRALDFHGVVGSGYELDMSGYASPAGVSPMELIVAGLASCTGMDVISILQKKRQKVSGLTIEVVGERADDHPMVYTSIEIVYIVQGEGIDPAAVARSIELSQTKYCSVSAMLHQAGINLRTAYEIEPVLIA
jgi:putative redox protein